MGYYRDDIRNRGMYSNPKSRKCPIHLRRVCGTCKFFTGKLRSQSCAPCQVYKYDCHPHERASECEFWTRETVA